MSYSDYSENVVIRSEPARVTIVEAGAKIRVSLDLVLNPGPTIRVEREGGSTLLHLIAANGTVTYRIDGYDPSSAALLCTRVLDGRNP